MPRTHIFAPTLIVGLLSACGPTPAQKAEQDYDFIRANGGSDDEICQAARKIQKAYREAQDANKYQLARVTADIDCQRAELDRLQAS